MRPAVQHLAAPAKLNLYLEVVGRRADGYRLLETVFAKLSLKDSLTLRPAEGFSLKVEQKGPVKVPAGPDNLVLKAAQAFRDRFGGPGAAIRLVKRIPAGAGLGGGSSDAAAVLRGLARWTPVPVRPLARLAAGLGADVPFFLQEAPLALGRGIGEKLKALPAPRPPWAVVAFPGFSVPTAEAFRRLKTPPPASLTKRRNLSKILENLKAGRPPADWDRFLFNRLEEPVLRFWPETLRMKGVFESLGARPLLSGSGSCVFALCSGQAGARRLASSLRSACAAWNVYSTRVLDC